MRDMEDGSSFHPLPFLQQKCHYMSEIKQLSSVPGNDKGERFWKSSLILRTSLRSSCTSGDAQERYLVGAWA